MNQVLLNKGVTPLHMGSALHQVGLYGAHVVPGILPEETLKTLNRAAEQLPLIRAKHNPGNQGVRQEMNEWQHFPEIPCSKAQPLLQIRDALEKLLLAGETYLGKTPHYEKVFASKLSLNSVRIHEYWEGSIGITPHMDGPSNINIICVFVLAGELKFQLCANRQGINPVNFFGSPGDLILMCTKGFVLRNEMVFHQVIPGDDRRVTFGLRQVIDRP